MFGKMREFLQKTAGELARYLEQILPSINENWWQECVVRKGCLSREQRRKNVNSLRSLDLQALLKVLDSNWYEISKVKDFSSDARHYVKEMVTVRNRDAHSSGQGVSQRDKERDLDTLSRFLSVIEANRSLIEEVEQERNQTLLENDYFRKQRDVETTELLKSSGTISKDTLSQAPSYALISRDPDAAVSDYTKAIETNPKDAEAYTNRAHARFWKGDLDGAIADYNKAIEINPENANAYIGRGNARERNGNLDGAIADYNRAIEMDLARSPAYYYRASAHLDKRNFDAFVADWIKACEIDPEEHCGEFTYISPFCDLRGDFDRANDRLTEWMRSYSVPGRSDALLVPYVFRAVARYYSGNLQGTIADCTVAIDLDPVISMPYIYRACAYIREADLDAGIRDCSAGIEMDPSRDDQYALLHKVRAIARHLKKDFDAAIDDYTTLVNVLPNDWVGYKNRGICYLAKCDFKAAFMDFTRAIDLTQDAVGQAHASWQRGISRHAMGDLTGAIADFTEAVNRTTSFPSRESGITLNRAMIYDCRGRVYVDMGDLDRAIADYDEAIRLNPNYAEAYNDRGLALARKEKGDLEGALKDLEKAVELDPREPYFRNNLERLRKLLE